MSFIKFQKIFEKFSKLADFWPKNSHLARILPILDLNGRFLKIYKNECLEPLGGPNKLKIEMDSLWGILKKIIYQIFDILIFRDFLAPESPKIAIFRRFLPFLHFSGLQKSRKIKISKIW